MSLRKPSRRLFGGLALALCLAGPLLAQEPSAAAPAAAQADPSRGLDTETPATAVVWGREIVTLRTSYGGRTPAERAREIEARTALALEANPRAPIHVLSATEGTLRGTLVLAGSEVLFGILEGDLPVGGSLETEASAAAARLRDLTAAIQRQRDTAAVTQSIAKSVAAITALFLLVWLLEHRLRLSVLARSRIVAKQAAREAAVRTGSARLDGTFLKAAALRTALRAALLFAELFAAFLCAQFVLRQFPYTEPLGNQLAGRILTFAGDVGRKVADALPDLFVVAVVVLAARAAWKLVKRWTTAVETGLIGSAGLDAETAGPTRILLGIGIGAMAAVIAYPFIPGSGTEAFKGVSVLLGVMVSLGGASVIGQLIAGLVVLYSRAVRRGDFVRVGEHEGHVVEVGLLATRLSTAYAEQINIPSAVMVTAVSRNSMRFAAPGGTVLRTAVTVGYDTPWRLVHGLLLDSAKRIPGVLPSPPPRVLQRSLGEFFVEYVLSMQFDRKLSRGDVTTTLHATILDAFNAHGVQIMAPHYEAQPDRRVVVPREQWAPEGAIPGVPPPAQAVVAVPPAQSSPADS